MSENINNGMKNMDDYLRNILENYQAEPSTNLWSKINHQLIKKDFSEFVRFKKLKKSFNSQHNTISMQIKVWTSYAAAALLAIGFVFGSSYLVTKYVINKPATKTNNVIVPVIPNPINSNISKMDSIEIPDNSVSITNKLNNDVPQNRDDAKSSNSNANVNNIFQQGSPVIFNSPTTKPQAVETSNISTLINYIQKMNPESKISTSEKTTEAPDEEIAIENDLKTLSKDTIDDVIPTTEYKIEIPNVITPNSDGKNDVLIIKNLDKFIDNNLLIGDRNGKVVYQSNSYQNDWDAPDITDGTYYYIFSYKDKNNVKKTVKGTITIIRK